MACAVGGEGGGGKDTLAGVLEVRYQIRIHSEAGGPGRLGGVWVGKRLSLD